MLHDTVALGLAALGYLSVSGRIVESMIAASIILVAANNIFPKFKEGSALIIFSFGLFHGLGFASVMGEIPFRIKDLVKVLIGFNLGVEIGQIVIVILAFGILYVFRSFQFYVPIVLRFGSAAAGLVATFWLIERAVGL
ncbi:MAG: HupE/UreJ family protein [Verrucomicrobia bacterium]|nr:HupE/UreJ family protein [Verrucomicrobiota bacterium]